VATPHDSHPEITICALEHGVHVYCEKPLGVHVKAARPMIEAAKRSSAVFVVGFQKRTLPIMRKAKEMIEGGELGALRRAIMLSTAHLRTQAYYASGGWRGTWDGEGGGVLLNQAPHDLDIFQWLAGMPDRVRAFVAFGKYHDIEVEDDVTAYLEWGDGMSGLFVTTTGEYPGTNRFEIHGDRGRLVIEGDKLLFDKSAEPASEHIVHSEKRMGGPGCETIEVPVTGEGGGWGHVHRNFVNAILHGEPLISPGVEGIRSLELGNAMVLSGVREETVPLPLDGDAYEALLREKTAAARVVSHHEGHEAHEGNAET